MNDWIWITKEAVLAAHDKLLAEYGGAEGIRDMGALEGALGRTQNLAAYGAPSLAELTALYAIGIAKAHAFVDGNKRTAWSTANAFLFLNGYDLRYDRLEAVEIMVSAADGTITDSDLSAWFCKNITPARRLRND